MPAAMQYRRGVRVGGAVALGAAFCCAAYRWSRQAVGRTDPIIELEVVPYIERVQENGFVGYVPLMEDGLPKRVLRARLAMNPLLMTLYYCRARVTNGSPAPLRLYHAHSIIRHESGRELAYRDVLVERDLPPGVVTVPPGGQAVVAVDLFGVPADDEVIPTGRYEIRVVLRSPDSEAEYISPPVSITLTAEQLLEYRRGW